MCYCPSLNIHTSFTIPAATRRNAKPRTYIFLFSLQQLSNCKSKISGILPYFLTWFSNVSMRTFIVRLLSDGWSAVVAKMYKSLPCGMVPWTRAPVKWVLSRQLCWLPLSSLVRCGMLVFDWSIPSMATHKYFEEFLACCFFFSYSRLSLL